MKIHSPSDDDNRTSPTWADLREFSLRREEERNQATRRPSHDDDAWRWFLSIFADQQPAADQSEERPNRKAA